MDTILVARESMVLNDSCKSTGENQVEKVGKWKRKTPMVREMCDVCVTTIFNYHWACTTCGFVACVTCKRDRERRSKKNYVSVCFTRFNCCSTGNSRFFLE